MTVDRKEVEAMSKLVEFFRSSSESSTEDFQPLIVEGDNLDISEDVLPRAIPISEHADAIPVAKIGGGGAMYDILLRLNSVEGGDSETRHVISEIDDMQHVAAAVIENSTRDRDLRESIATERTSRGARVGSWEIVVTESEPKTYDVVHVNTDDAIATGLSVYEAALALTNALNDGVSINHHRIQNILRLEEDYSRNREDARRFKHGTRIAESEGDSQRAGMTSARYSESRRRAVAAHTHLKHLVQSR